ncbi:hypothetical protein F5Y04DRAFT_265515 [Hypomontagnella monticulosa]|nr:hypothetical protein F5Y04DRAFT_265515 [Hypomontagnella monticulosa]
MLSGNSKILSVLVAALLASQAAAKTDIAGCVSSKTVAYGGASLIWYVPDTGEICELLDCGGGRAPPKTTVPGCAAYEGTATYSPKFLSGFGAAATPSSTVNSISVSTSVSSSESSEAPDTTPPTTITTGPVITSSGTTTTTTSDGVSSTSTGNSQGTEPTSASNSTSTSGSTSVSQGAAAMPTVGAKGAVGMAVGFAAGMAML